MSNAVESKQRYDEWLRTKREPPPQPPWRVVDFSKASVFFSIILDCDGAPMEQLARTIETIGAQTLVLWEAHLISRAPLRREELRKLTRGRKHFSVKMPKELELHGTHVCYLTAGDLLEKDAFYFLYRELEERPELDFVYSDEDWVGEDGRHFDAWFKPDWSPELLLSENYAGRLCAVNTARAKEVGGADLRWRSASGYELLVRVSERGAKGARVARVCCSVVDTPWRRKYEEKRFAEETRALAERLTKRELPGRVESGLAKHTRTARFPVRGEPVVSIIVPFSDKPEMLERCVRSILERTSYRRFELLLVSNNSKSAETAALMERLADPPKIRTFEHDVPFNYSAVNNWAARQAVGDYLLFLNNDTEVVEGRWLEYMLEYAQQPDIGEVGAKLLFPDGTIQHAGVIVGMAGMASHIFSRQKEEECYRRQASVVRNYLAVTAACMLISEEKFWKVGGFDESFVLCGSDVALGLSLAAAGYRNVYHAGAVLTHFEKATRGGKIPAGDYTASFRYYRPYLEHGDPYYNPNLSLASKDCSLRWEEEDNFAELAAKYGSDPQRPSEWD